MMSSMTSSMMMTEDFDEEEDETSGTSWRDISVTVAGRSCMAIEQSGHLPVSDVICIVMHTSPLKTNDVATENKHT